MMRPAVTESRAFDGWSWTGDAVVTPTGTYGGPALYAPGSAPYRALEDDLPSSYVIVNGAAESNIFMLGLPAVPPSYTRVRTLFSWVDGEYLEGLENQAIRFGYGNTPGGATSNAGAVVEIGPMQWQVDWYGANPFGSSTLRLLTNSSDPRRLHVWSILIGDDAAQSQGLWPLRQRQSLVGGGSWPLRQRQNGAHSGSWPLRQRQAGV